MFPLLASPIVADPAGLGEALVSAPTSIQLVSALLCGFAAGVAVLRTRRRNSPAPMPAGHRRSLPQSGPSDVSVALEQALTTMELQRRTGDFSRHIEVDDDSDIGRLAAQYNRVLDEVNAQKATLKREIQKRRTIAAALAESESQFRRLLDATGAGIYGVDLNGDCTFCNRTCAALLGFDDHVELIGENMHELAHHSTADGRHRPVEESQVYHSYDTGKEVHVHDEVVWRRDGTSISAEYWSIPVRDGDRVVGSVVTFIDIAERKQVEEENSCLELELRHSHKMEAVGVLAGGIAHDFNNVLGVIIGQTELALKSEGLRADQRLGESLERILEAGCRAKRVVGQLLTFSRQAPTEHSPVRIDRAVDAALTLVEASIPAMVEIDKQIAHDCGSVEANETQIHQVIMNLCSNAHHALGGAAGCIEISLHPVEQLPAVIGRPATPIAGVRLRVRDNGCGMDAEIKSHIFDPFFTTKPIGHGTGMGLAVVHGIISEHQGTIVVDSTPGAGTTVDVYLPTIATSAEPSAEPGSARQASSVRILLVDDEEALADSSHWLLVGLGYEPTTFTSSTEALAHFREDPGAFDLVISDQAMPHMSGLDLATELLELRPDLPIVIASGFSEQVSPKTIGEYGIRGYLAKPYRECELLEAIETALERK